MSNKTISGGIPDDVSPTAKKQVMDGRKGRNIVKCYRCGKMVSRESAWKNGARWLCAECAGGARA